jgi:hypothetical protein
MRAWRTGLAAIGAAVLAAAPAAALDTATGVYTGKATCRQIVAGATSKSKQDVSFTLAQTGLDVSLSAAGTDLVFTNLEGHVAADADKLERGAFVAFTCGGPTVAGFALHGDLVIKSSGKASLKGTVVELDSKADKVRICTFSAKRTSISAPPIIPCVPLP